MTLIDRLRAKSSSLYSVRDRIGFKAKVYILTRTWPMRLGVGVPKDEVVRIIPNPGITDLSLKRMASPHGQTIMGDIMLTGIAFDLYSREDLGNATEDESIERFYLIKGNTYAVGAITEKFVSYSVVLTKTNKDLWRDELIPEDK